MALTIGIDAGSAAVKAVALGEVGPVSWLTETTRPDLQVQTAQMLRSLVAELGQPDRICATGYGRELVEGAHVRVSEIMANALGAGWLWRNWLRLADLYHSPPRPLARPEQPRTIIDVGGQDCKVITFAPGGIVEQFAMNDRCAAGTGRFLDVMARVLGVDLVTMDELAVSAECAAAVSSACTVFAESEVISLLGDGRDRSEVAAGIYASVAARIAGLARQVAAQSPVFLDGGPSHGRMLRRALCAALDCEVAVPPRGELVTALGAALYAAENQTSGRPC